MDKILDARFERLEKALAALVESIAKYNPSSTVVQELLAADADLADGFKELEKHQNNFLRIQQLRAESEQLDGQIKQTIQSLWTIRKELTNTTATAYPEPKYELSYEELLNYARRISRTTLPPPGITNGVDAKADGAKDGDTSAEHTNAPTPVPVTSMNGSQTPVPGPSRHGSATPMANGVDSQSTEQPSQATTTSTELPESMQAHLNLLQGAYFFPWPTEDKIRSGALAFNQQLREQGIDPRGYDPEEEERKRKAAEEERKEAEEQQRLAREESERQMREERERMARERERGREQAGVENWRRGSVILDGAAGGAAAGASSGAAPRSSTSGPAEPKQFQFMGGMEDDDDDD